MFGRALGERSRAAGGPRSQILRPESDLKIFRIVLKNYPVRTWEGPDTGAGASWSLIDIIYTLLVPRYEQKASGDGIRSASVQLPDYVNPGKFDNSSVNTRRLNLLRLVAAPFSLLGLVSGVSRDCSSRLTLKPRCDLEAISLMKLLRSAVVLASSG